MASAVDADPVKALRGAERDGLLTYHGSVSGGRYEVQVAGSEVSRVLLAAEVIGTVERLRAVASLSEAGAEARLAALRGDGTHVITFGSEGEPQLQVELPADQVVDWCAGYTAAAAGRGQEHEGVDQLGQIAELFENPTRDDQCRMVLLGLMAGVGVRPRVSAERLVEMIGDLPGVDKPPVKKTVVDALGFGGYLASDLAEKMIRAFGLRWSVTAGPATCERAEGGALVEPLPEMPGLVALRRIVAASRSGWLRYVDEPAPNKARWKPERDRQYRLAVGSVTYAVGADGLDAWLDGVAAYHAGRD